MSLHVVQVNSALDDTGRSPEALLEAWPTLPAVATATARAGARVTVLQASGTEAELHRDGVTYKFVREPRFGTRAKSGLRPGRLVAAVRREQPDVIHFHGLNFPSHCRAICTLGIPMLVQDHGSSAQSRIAALRGWGLRNVAAAAFTSREQAEPFVRSGQLPTQVPIFAIPESSSDFTPGPQAEARGATGVIGSPALLWVGHLAASKDPMTVLRAAQQAIDHLPGLHLWCAYGSAELLPEIRALLRRDPRLAERVHLLGKVGHDTVERLCRACDLLVLGSRREGSCYVLIEALACGLPAIVTDIPSFRALTGDGQVGALVPAGDTESFAQAIVELARQPSEDLRRRTRAHFERNLSFDVVGRLLVRAYASLAAQSAEAA